MRGSAIGIGRKLANPSSFSISAQTLAPFSTSSSGRGRGRGGPAPSFFNPIYEKPAVQQPGPLPSAGHGKPPPDPQSFGSGIRPDAPAGRGHPGHVPGESREVGEVKMPGLFRREESAAAEEINDGIMASLNGLGWGKPDPVASDPVVENRRRVEVPVEPRKLKMSAEEAGKKAMEILCAGDEPIEGAEEREGAGGRRGERGMTRGGGGGGRGMGAMRGRGGRGGRGRGRRDREGGDWRRREDQASVGIVDGLFLGDNADGEKLAKRLGPEVMNQLTEAFEDMSNYVLPSPLDDAEVDALDINCKIEFEPEYLMQFQNPDIDEKPALSIRDALEKMKPFLMVYEDIQNQEEWEEAIKETMKTVPLLKEIVDHYSGPDRVTAMKQREELERVAKTLPAKVPDSVKQFTDRAVLSLQGNPGWGFHRKCQFMDKLTQKVSKHYK